ncbi:MAG: BMP family ABC transporter substrate-binding protein [Synergistaceae bacterium]|nr:BMP family ABC transporter substrate-binding protein [Synergistaceae bacterium]
MKGKRIALAVSLACVLALVLGARWVFMQTEKDEAAPEWRPGASINKEDLKIGVIHLTDPLNEKGGYSYAHEAGIREAQQKTGLTDGQIIRKNNVGNTNLYEVEHAMRECIAEGARVIIATSWEHMDACEKLAAEYPSVIFTNASGYKQNDTNFTNYFGRIYQARYLSGIAAGLKTESGKIGYVAAMGKDNSEVTGGIDAFAIGVESVNRDARIYVKVTERWYDPAEEANAAKSLIALGCDVIAQHCDTVNPQIEAQRAGVWGVGYNSDLREDIPGTVIVSVVWNWGAYYARLIESVIDGSFTTAPYFGGISDGIVGLTSLDETLLPPGAALAVEEARERIASGEFDVFSGVMETNDGRFVGSEGETLPDSEITQGIDWYYRNVAEQ